MEALGVRTTEWRNKIAAAADADALDTLGAELADETSALQEMVNLLAQRQEQSKTIKTPVADAAEAVMIPVPPDPV